MSAAREMAGFEYFEVAADVGVRAWGPDLPECFRQCARGVFNLIVPLDAVEPAESREVAAQGEGPETLLANWINECLYLHDIEGFVVRDVDSPRVDGGRIHAFLRGEPFDPARHPRGTVVKAVTCHRIERRHEPDGIDARLVLDV